MSEWRGDGEQKTKGTAFHEGSIVTTIHCGIWGKSSMIYRADWKTTPRLQIPRRGNRFDIHYKTRNYFPPNPSETEVHHSGFSNK
jgi:hypothetical protein